MGKVIEVKIHGEYKEYYATDEQLAEIDHKNKKVQIYRSRIERYLKRMDNDQAAELIRAIVEYSRTWVVPEIGDSFVSLAFEDIQEGMDWDRNEYYKTCITNSVVKGGTKYMLYEDWKKLNERPSTTVNDRQRPLTTVTDKDKDIDKNINKDIDKDTGKDSKGNPVYETMEDAYNVFDTFCTEYGVSGQNKNIVLKFLQEQYNNGECYRYNELRGMAEHPEVICENLRKQIRNSYQTA